MADDKEPVEQAVLDLPKKKKKKSKKDVEEVAEKLESTNSEFFCTIFSFFVLL